MSGALRLKGMVCRECGEVTINSYDAPYSAFCSRCDEKRMQRLRDLVDAVAAEEKKRTYKELVLEWVRTLRARQDGYYYGDLRQDLLGLPTYFTTLALYRSLRRSLDKGYVKEGPYPNAWYIPGETWGEPRLVLPQGSTAISPSFGRWKVVLGRNGDECQGTYFTAEEAYAALCDAVRGRVGIYTPFSLKEAV